MRNTNLYSLSIFINTFASTKLYIFWRGGGGEFNWEESGRSSCNSEFFSSDFINGEFEFVVEVQILKGFNHKESCGNRSIEMLEFLISFRDELQLPQVD